jgi:hypothetical protein
MEKAVNWLTPPSRTTKRWLKVLSIGLETGASGRDSYDPKSKRAWVIMSALESCQTDGTHEE